MTVCLSEKEENIFGRLEEEKKKEKYRRKVRKQKALLHLQSQDV